MATREELYAALRNADAAGDTEGARKLASYIQSMPMENSAPAPTEDRSALLDGIKGLGAGLGKGVGTTALGAQRYLGKGIQALGDLVSPDTRNVKSLITGKKDRGLIQSAGDWLVNDADQGRARLADENAPYKAASPFANGAGVLGGEVLATAPVGGLIAKAASPLLAGTRAAPLLEAIRSAGFRTGLQTATLGSKALDMGVRAAGGAINGGVSAGLIDPENAKTGAIFGAALPGVAKVGGKIGSMVADGVNSASERLMQSAIKPTIAQLKNGDAATAVETLLKYGINPTKGGVNKLRGLVDDLNTQIADRISSSTATVDKQNVLNGLGAVRTKFGNQVSPTADLKAIQSAADDFLNHPNLPGAQIPVQAAQDLKQGTYRVLSKKYGQMGSADVEAQKALARGLKDEIAQAVPGIGALNAEESKLISTLGVAERRALMEMNKNPMGLASLAQSPASWAMFMADKSALFKSITARMLNSTAGGAQRALPQLENGLANPLLRNPALLISTRGDAQ